MTKHVTMDVDGVTLYIETEDEETIKATENNEFESVVKRGGNARGGFREEKVTGAAIDPQKMVDSIRAYCGLVVKAVKETSEAIATKPDSLTMEFGIGATATGDAWVIKASGNASLKVSINWKLGS